jgi:hypothetical protein
MDKEWQDDHIYEVTVNLCGRCLNGEGGECHTPGCGFFLNRAPDLALSAKDGWPVKAHKDCGVPDYESGPVESKYPEDDIPY